VLLDNQNGPTGKITCFYGHPDVAKRKEAWTLLRFLSNLAPTPWMCVGDFNEILTAAEKSCSSIHPRCQMQEFQLALDDCHLADMGYKGPRFTWGNDRPGEEITRERLDKAVANAAWSKCFNLTEVEVLARVSSDHHPLLVNFSKTQDIQWKKSYNFRYEASWAKRPDYGEIIKKA